MLKVGAWIVKFMPAELFVVGAYGVQVRMWLFVIGLMCSGIIAYV